MRCLIDGQLGRDNEAHACAGSMLALLIGTQRTQEAGHLGQKLGVTELMRKLAAQVGAHVLIVEGFEVTAMGLMQ